MRGARWAEIDLRAGVWTIPATRMKAKREHRIPLSGRAAQILEAARPLGDGRGPLVFPSKGRNPISITRLPRLLQDHKIAAVPHGFRSSFRDWAAEETNHPREVVEAALAHVVGNQTEAAYARTDLFERRRPQPPDWRVTARSDSVRGGLRRRGEGSECRRTRVTVRCNKAADPVQHEANVYVAVL